MEKITKARAAVVAATAAFVALALVAGRTDRALRRW